MTHFYQLLLRSTKFYHLYDFIPTFILLLPPSTNFYYLLPTFILFLATLSTFYQLLPLPTNFTTFHQFLLSSANFYQLYITFRQLLPTSINFYTSFHQSKMILFFFYVFSSSSDIHQSHRLVVYQLQALISLLILFLYTTRCLYLLHHAISLT